MTIRWDAFSASAWDLTLEQSLTSNQVGGGCTALSEEVVDAPVRDSSWARAESKVGRLVTEAQYVM